MQQTLISRIPQVEITAEFEEGMVWWGRSCRAEIVEKVVLSYQDNGC
jgi:hypothetical protein